MEVAAINNQNKISKIHYNGKNYKNTTQSLYNSIKSDILNNNHKILPDGRIRQYKVREMKTEKRLPNHTEYSCKTVDIPYKELCPDGKIVIYQDIPLKIINSGKRFVVLEDDTPVCILNDMTFYYPNGEIYRIVKGKFNQLM